jgi:hypothetical protein
MTVIDIFLERMAYLIYIEKRPFCYLDFVSFEHEGKRHEYVHGSIRNIFSTLRKQGKIEFVYQSIQAYYSLTGVKIGKPITPGHGEGCLNYKQNRFMAFLQNLPMDKPCIHDIRLRAYPKIR